MLELFRMLFEMPGSSDLGLSNNKSNNNLKPETLGSRLEASGRDDEKITPKFELKTFQVILGNNI